MVSWIYKREKGIKYSFCLATLFINLTGLYYIIDLIFDNTAIESTLNYQEGWVNLEGFSVIIALIILVNVFFSGSFIIKKNIKT